MRTLIALLLGLGSLVNPAYAGTMYTVDNANAVLMKIDTTTLQLTAVGPLGVAFQYGGLAWDPVNSTLYMIDGRGAKSLYTVNTATGAATLVGPHGLTDLFGLTFDTGNGKMYATQFIVNTPLETLNLSTGAATAIGTGAGNARIGTLAYNTNTNQLIGLQDCLGCAVLYSIDINTGAQTVLQSAGLDTNNSGMTYDPALNRFWDVDVNGRLSYFDPANGYAQTQVKTFTTSLTGLAYVSAVAPPPGAPIPTLSQWALALLAITLAGIAASSLRRTRRVRDFHRPR